MCFTVQLSRFSFAVSFEAAYLLYHTVFTMSTLIFYFLFSSKNKFQKQERRRRDLNPRAATNDLLPFQGSPFGQLGYFSIKSGEGGIRTHAPFRTNGFQDRLVMTASIPLRASLTETIEIISAYMKDVNYFFCFFSIFLTKLRKKPKSIRYIGFFQGIHPYTDQLDIAVFSFIY